MNLPDGFQLDVVPEASGLPDGFVLDQPSLGSALAKVWENPTAPVKGEISLPGIGAPSLIGTLKSLYEGATLPGDVYTGKVAPGSEEGMRRTMGLAGLTSLGATAAPPGALGSGLVRPAAAVKAAERVTPQELAAAGKAGIKEAEGMPVPIGPEATLDYVARVRNALAHEGPSDIRAPGVYAEIDRLERSAKTALTAGPKETNTIVSGPGFHIAEDIPTSAPLMPRDMTNFRARLTEFQKTPTPDSAAAGIAKSVFDDWLASHAPGLADKIKEYTANFRAAHLGADVASPVNRGQLRASASNSGMNIENRIRNSFVTTVAKEVDREMRGRATKFSPAIRQQMEQFIEKGGNPGANFTRGAGNYLGGGGGALASIYGLSGALSHPILALAPLIGAGLKGASNRAAVKAADRIAQAVMATAPLARQRQQIATQIPPQLQRGLLALLTRNPQALLSSLSSPPIAISSQ